MSLGKNVESSRICKGRTIELWEETRNVLQKKLDEGEAALFKKMTDDSIILFHKCIMDPNTQNYKDIVLDEIEFTLFERPIDELLFDAVVFNKVKKALVDLGYSCRCGLKTQILGKKVKVMDLALPKFGVNN
jgi:hypothetical protein